MTFLSPLMVLGALAAAIPLGLHFFYRAHYRPLPWAAMKFLRLSIEQTSRRLRFQEFVLLVLRVLVCLLLALAFMRVACNSVTGGNGRGESVDAVIILDNSYSMSAPVTDGKTRLELAKEAAVKIIENLPPRSTVQVISCSDKAVNLGPHSPSNLDQARQAINSIKTCSLSTDFTPGLQEAINSLDKTPGANKEVYLISDMQRSGWERQATAIRSKCEEVKNQATFYLVRCCEDKPLANVAIIGVLPQTDIPSKGASVAFTVLLKNSGREPVENLNLSLRVDGEKKFSKDDVAINRVDAGETKAVTIYGQFLDSGWRLVTASINGAGDKSEGLNAPRANKDAIKEDDKFSRMVYVYEKVRVLIVDGAPNSADPSQSASFFIGNALLPVTEEKRGAYHIALTTLPPEMTNATSLADQDICVLVNVSAAFLRPEFTSALDQFVHSGKGLLITTGNQVAAAPYNTTFAKLLPVPLVDSPPVKAPEDQFFAPDLSTIDIYSFLAKFKEKGQKALEDLAKGFTREVTPVSEPKNVADKANAARVLIRFDNGLPMLVSKTVGSGEVMLLTTSVDRSWSEMCRLPAFYFLVNGCVAQMIEHGTSSYNRVAGDVVRFAPNDLQQEYWVIPPEGERKFLGKPKDFEGQMRLPAFDTSTAGVYEIAGADPADKVRFAFVPDLRESENLESLSDDKIDDQLGFKPIHLSTGFDGKLFTGTERSKNEWTVWVLTILLVFAFGETLWAWACGRTW